MVKEYSEVEGQATQNEQPRPNGTFMPGVSLTTAETSWGGFLTAIVTLSSIEQ